MKRMLVVVAIVGFGVYLAGCAKKETVEDLQGELSMDIMSASNTATAPTVTVTAPTVTKAPDAKIAPPSVAVTTAPTGAVPALPQVTKPTTQDIQQALKNAGLYTGAIDGKLGPMTKQAITAFQKEHNLEADGKVGPKTWAALSAFLNATPVSPVTKQTR